MPHKRTKYKLKSKDLEEGKTNSKRFKNSVIISDRPTDGLLWTEKYKPNNSSEVIGHKRAVNKLKQWLEGWNNTSDNRVNDAESEEDSDVSNTCLLICGPTGSGKTSLVYAIAEELKYEILELNASMKRSSRIINKIVGEATQSHHMQRTSDSQTNNLNINSIESLFSKKINNNFIDSEIKIEKVVKPVKKPKNKGILNYFKKQNNKITKNSQKDPEIEIIDDKRVAEVITLDENWLKLTEKVSEDMLFSPKVLSITCNSLILFDDVDVIIDEDCSGFWSAVNKINEITKKPVILTATQFIPYIKDCLNRLQVLTLDIPDHNQTVSALKSICDKEVDGKGGEISVDVCEHLSNTLNHDIRRCINELQFGWEEWKTFKAKPDKTNDDNQIQLSYYDSFIFEDIFKKKFNILSNEENRDLWMNCKPTLIENENETICLAKDIINTMNELKDDVFKECHIISRANQSLAIDSESIASISESLTKNVSLQSTLLDYCPYLSFICEAESIRQSEGVNHSRRSRRFMHHLDSIGFYIGDCVKTKLISSINSQLKTDSNQSRPQVNEDSNETLILSDFDNDFYD